MIYKKVTTKDGVKTIRFMTKSDFVSRINDRAAHETRESIENVVRIMEIYNSITFNFGADCFSVTDHKQATK